MLDSVANIADLRRLARRRVPRVFQEYVEAGSYDELTLRANRNDLDALVFRQRTVNDVSGRKCSSRLCGAEAALPLALAPAGLIGAVHVNGEIHAAHAAERFGVPFCLSTMSICSIEDVAAATRQPFWFQIYLMKDRGFTQSLLERAKAVGCPVLVLTMDLHVEGRRNADVRNGLNIPPRLTFANVLDILSSPAWALSMLRSKHFTFGNLEGHTKGGDLTSLTEWVRDQFDPHFTARDIAWARKLWPGTLLVKGILDPEDARVAVASGADAIVVSNHGGRQLDGAPSSVAAFPRIREAVGDDAEVWFDSGIRSGLDLLKALALGADGCLIGRAFIYGLGAAGEVGVVKALEIIRDELDTAMALTGITDASAVPESVLLSSTGVGSTSRRSIHSIGDPRAAS
jgi:L-lactate dehydrogenase (cytochrome)